VHQKGNPEQVPYWQPTIIRYHCTQCSHLGNIMPRICAPRSSLF